ncbi:hypothetical protein ACHQM5_006244 [Ranunculus cassubicifolius]
MAFFSLFAILVMSLVVWKYIFLQKKTKTKSSTPFALPLLGHLHLIVKKPLHRTLAKLGDQYGPTLFLSYGFRKVVLISSASTIEECLTINDVAFGNRPHLIVGEYLGYNYTNLVFSGCGDHWRNLRRITAQEISSNKLQTFANVRSQEVRSLVLKLFGKKSGGTDFYKVEFSTMFFELMLNTIMRITAGKNVSDPQETQRVRQIVRDSTHLLGSPNLGDFLPFLKRFDLQGLKKRMVKTRRDRDMLMQSLVDERRAMREFAKNNGEEKKTMIDVMLSYQQNDPEYYTDNIIKGQIGTMLTAGTDTTSSAMEWTMSLLLNHPEHLTKVRNEINTQVGQERLVEESDLVNLPFLHNVMNEALRLYPTGPVTTRETNKDCTVGGVHLAKGTMIQMNFWAVNRDPTVWENPEIFDPERFERDEGKRDSFKWLSFGSGRRRCPGEVLATRMIGMALATMIQCFEWKRLGEEMVDMREGYGLTLPKANPLVAMCKPRSIMDRIV